jgi:single-strand DNA-binding protein
MFAKLVRLGRDAEVKYTQNGDPVASLAMVYDIGFGDKKRSQWIDGALWGKRAESLGPYLTKGSQVVLYADDVELEQFMKKDGTPGAKLKCRVSDLSLISGQSQQAPQQQQATQRNTQQYQNQGQQQQQQQAQQQAPQYQNQPPEFEDVPF